MKLIYVVYDTISIMKFLLMYAYKILNTKYKSRIFLKGNFLKITHFLLFKTVCSLLSSIHCKISIKIHCLALVQVNGTLLLYGGIIVIVGAAIGNLKTFIYL